MSYGRALYQLAKRDLGDLEMHIEHLHRLYGNSRDLTVRIAGRTDLLDFLAPYLDFEGKIEFVSQPSAKAVEKLLANEVDIALSYKKPDSTEIAAKPLLLSKPLFVAHDRILNGKRLTRSLAADPDFLTKTPCIMYDANGHLLKEWVEQSGLKVKDLRAAFVINEWRAIQALVEKGLGYAIVPSYVPISDEVQRVEVQGRGLGTYTFYALFEKNMRKIPAFRTLLSFSRTPLKLES